MGNTGIAHCSLHSIGALVGCINVFLMIVVNIRSLELAVWERGQVGVQLWFELDLMFSSDAETVVVKITEV